MPTKGGTPYPLLPGLDGYYFEDSYVLSIRLGGDSIEFEVLAVLTTDHPEYAPASPGEQHCYRRGRLTFRNLRRFGFLDAASVWPSIDADGTRDLGSIDSLTLNDRTYRIEGDWGVMEVESDPPSMVLDASDLPDAN